MSLTPDPCPQAYARRFNTFEALDDLDRALTDAKKVSFRQRDRDIALCVQSCPVQESEATFLSLLCECAHLPSLQQQSACDQHKSNNEITSQVLELEPGNAWATVSVRRLEPIVKARHEKLKVSRERAECTLNTSRFVLSEAL